MYNISVQRTLKAVKYFPEISLRAEAFSALPGYTPLISIIVYDY